MWYEKPNVRTKSFFASPVEIKLGSLTRHIREKAPELKTMFPELVREIATTKQNGAAKWEGDIIPRMKPLSFGLRLLKNFLIDLGQSRTGILWIVLTHLGIMNRAMFVGRLLRSKPPIAYLAVIGRK